MSEDEQQQLNQQQIDSLKYQRDKLNIDSTNQYLHQQLHHQQHGQQNAKLLPSPISSIGSRRNVPTPLTFPIESSTSIESPFSSAGLTGCSSLLSTPADSISPTVLLSPVLSRPVRSQSAHSSPFIRNTVNVSDSDSEIINSRPGSGVWSNALYRQSSRTSRNSRPSESSSPLATPPHRCLSPTTSNKIYGSIKTCNTSRESVRRNNRGSPLIKTDSFDGGNHSSGGSLSSHLIPPLKTIQRSHSDAVDPDNRLSSTKSLLNEHYLNRIKKMKRRPSIVTTSSNNMLKPVDYHHNSENQQQHGKYSTNLMKYKHLSLGHSDPQLYTLNRSQSPCISNRLSIMTGNRRSFLLTSPLLMNKNKKESRNKYSRRSDAFLGTTSTSPNSLTVGQQQQSSSSGIRHRIRSSICSTTNSKLKHPGVIMRAGSSLAAPTHGDNRRWSLASLPSSSGYGTPGSNSAFSSQYSSQEHLADYINELKLNQQRFDSNDSYAGLDETLIYSRPRSRSLTSPVKFIHSDNVDSNSPMITTIYKGKFPKAKSQMEYKLQQFLIENAPLSGFTTNLSLDIRPTSPQPQPPTSPKIKKKKQQQQHRHRHGRSSPRPTSPLPRPISPLAMESATVTPSGFVLRSSFKDDTTSSTIPTTTSGSTLQPISSSCTPTTTSQNYHSSGSGSRNFINNSSAVTVTETLMQADPHLLVLLADGATRFLHHQICEIAADCLQKSRDDILTSIYFCDMTNRLDETILEGQNKCGKESIKYLSKLIKQLLMIVSRTARLLECLEFNPDEFYQLLEEAEGAVRYQLGSGNARVPDLPQYIINKLGLNKNLITDESELSPDEDKIPLKNKSTTIPTTTTSTSTTTTTIHGVKLRQKSSLSVDRKESGLISSGNSEKDVDSTDTNKESTVESLMQSLVNHAPKEDDFETIRLISNGAYGAVYLVRHKKTRQRFALKKMKKQTLLLRNQVDQVYAERDILTFTDNPFVVCFFGSFETKQHLCMLMEYVEGGDCASLLKSAGTLPLELTRLYVAETVLAIEYLHSCGIVHRDLKPDNLLITSMGHIKLTDFGLSKIGLMNRTTLVSEGYLDDTQQFKDNQLCGTPEYIAPEVILRQGYGKPVDWWALGVIIYEFLIGIVPFMGDTPEQLFANIINDEVEYPEGDEALDSDAENLIRQLLEKNPLDRLGTTDGAIEVTAHSFFNTLDFDSLLRQKAEFVPQLENDEDTSYFDSRSERYNHDADSGDDETVPMFWSFSTASPRHSIVGMEISPANLAALNAAAQASGASSSTSTTHPPADFVRKYGSISGNNHGSISDDGTGTPSTTGSGSHSVFSSVGQPCKRLSDSTDSQYFFDGNKLPPSSGSVGAKSLEGDYPTSTAVLLRRRFSSQRHNNLSTSSSGTNNTGCFNTGYSSTDSSMDASIPYDYYKKQQQYSNLSPLPRFSISSPNEQQQHRISPTSRINRLYSGSGSEDIVSNNPSELSPVQEKMMSSAFDTYSETNSRSPSAIDEKVLPEISTTESSKGYYRHKNPSTTTSTMTSTTTNDNSNKYKNKMDNLKVQIPQTNTSTTSSPSPQTTNTTTTSHGTSYYHSYHSSGQLSPSCQSVSSTSSVDGNNTMTLNPESRNSGSLSPIQNPNLLSTTNSKPSIIIKRGIHGFGFTVKSVRVYLSENSEYYTIEHMVSSVVNNSPAYISGLRENDLITSVKGEPVNNITHPQLMHKLLSCGNEISLTVTPLNNTSIKEGEGRRTVGKLLRRKPKKPQRRLPMDKKPRKSSNLLRRLSGKAADIVPGTSSQKQTFIPRSVSNQDGVASSSLPNQNQSTSTNLATKQNLPPVTVQMRVPSKSTNAHKRLSDFGISSASTSSDLPMIKSEMRNVTSPLAVEHPKVMPPVSPTKEKVSSPQKTSTFQEFKNMVHRFSQTASSSSSSSNTSTPAITEPKPVLVTQSSVSSTSRRNSSGMTISPLARQSIGGSSTQSSNIPPQRPPPPHFEKNESPKSSPIPSRKLSPSRLVRKIWKEATGQSSEPSGKDSTNK